MTVGLVVQASSRFPRLPGFQLWYWLVDAASACDISNWPVWGWRINTQMESCVPLDTIVPWPLRKRFPASNCIGTVKAVISRVQPPTPLLASRHVATLSYVQGLVHWTMSIEIQQIKKGDGKSFPRRGDLVTVHYVGTLASNGNKFDSSRDRGRPFKFKFRMGEVIQGCEEDFLFWRFSNSFRVFLVEYLWLVTTTARSKIVSRVNSQYGVNTRMFCAFACCWVPIPRNHQVGLLIICDRTWQRISSASSSLGTQGRTCVWIPYYKIRGPRVPAFPGDIRSLLKKWFSAILHGVIARNFV